ncbi:PIR protein, putative [Plasmodium sp. gorilla clade G1]|nr:PIR protein, putative [Plasmodium sp. gorilla clade G1]
MKIHYINILLFALPLNILVNNQSNPKKTILRKSKIKPTKTHRTLCECELYAPSNYENDPEMKELIENFNHQSSERFREYDEMIQDKRKQCKEQCEKDIRKIILKDKIEKELTEKFGALQTNITTEDIPTCVCEKSLADKTEKVCLNCGKTMGAVAPAWGIVSGLGYAAWTHYVPAKILEVGISEGIKEGLTQIMKFTISLYPEANLPNITVTQMLSSGHFNSKITLFDIVQNINSTINAELETKGFSEFSYIIDVMSNKKTLNAFNSNFSKYSTPVTEAIDAAEAAEGLKLATNTSILNNTIIASIVAIVVIVLVMVIIYLILRYRRKTKMKKKLQYIKLLKE